MYKGEGKKNKKVKVTNGKPFVFHRCYAELEHEEKWKARDEILKIARKRAQALEGDDGASSDEGNRSPTPNNSVANTKRPIGRK